jgi:hypothetical protein
MDPNTLLIYFPKPFLFNFLYNIDIEIAMKVAIDLIIGDSDTCKVTIDLDYWWFQYVQWNINEQYMLTIFCKLFFFFIVVAYTIN